MKRRGTATDKLANVIQLLQLVHKTGLLTVEYDGVDNTFEQGTITFRDGQVIDASVGSLSGADAFTKLTNWTNCHFVFQPSPLTDAPSLSSSPPPHILEQNNGSQRRIPYPVRYPSENLALFNSSGLTRIHRQLLMLIDGKRSVQDLIRLMGRRPDEIVTMLTDLESAGFIR